MQELQVRNLYLGLGYSEKTTRRASRMGRAVYYPRYSEASAFGGLELQEKASGQEQALIYM